MLDIMFSTPSDPTIKEVIITPEVVLEGKEPVRVVHKEAVAS